MLSNGTLSTLLYVAAGLIFGGTMASLADLSGKTVKPFRFLWFVITQVFFIAIMVLAGLRLGRP